MWRKLLSWVFKTSQISFQLTEEKEKPTALNVRVSLKMLAASKNSESSAAFAEATKILTATIEKLNAVVEKIFDNDAVFVVVTVAEHHAIRTKRQAPGEDTVSWFWESFGEIHWNTFDF